ncbi:MAG: hypothetical protein WC865_08955 [Bacteroidales bacterium]
MANNPLQKFGLIKVSDIMKEKEWIGNESKTLTALVTGNDKNAPYVVLNTYNPLVMRTGITTKPYSISEWYGYNHALTEDPTQLNLTITGGDMKSMEQYSGESDSGYGFYSNHFDILTNHLKNSTKGSAVAYATGLTALDIWTTFEVTDRVSGSAGNYHVHNQRGYLEINLSTVSTMRVVSKAEVLLTCISNTYTPCKIILVKYEGGSTFNATYYPYYQQISDPILFSTGEQTFTLNSAGIAYLNEKIASADKYFRVGIVTYEYDFLQDAYIGGNLLQGDDSTLASIGHWSVTSGYGASSLTNEITPDQKSRPVLKIVPSTSESIRFSISNTSFSSVPTTGVNYFFHCYYRFGGFPTSFDPAGFSSSTYVLLNGKQLGTYSAGLNSNLIRVDDPTGKSPEWQRGHHCGYLDSPQYGNDNTFSFYVGNGSNANYAVNEFAIADVKIVNPIFTKTFGGKYNSPKLKYYYDGYPGAVTTGSVSGVTATQATVGGTVTTDGRTVISVSGLCWNTTGNPTTADSKTTDGGTSVTSFSSTATGLTLGQTYYIRPYVTTEVGTYYGTQTSFTTLGLPTVTTQAASSVTSSSAVFNGTASADGGQSITDRGFVHKAGSDPIVTDNKTSASAPTGTGSFTLSKTGLTPGTTYYVKAFATNASGTQLSTSSFSFTTAAVLPTMSVSAVTNITATTATFNGSITDFGGASCTDRGFYFRLDAEPTLATFIDCGLGAQSTLGAFSYNYPGSLLKNRTYYVKAYGVNSAGTVLSPTSVSFTTLSTVPTLTVQGETNSASTSITLNGTVTDDGGHSVTDRGFIYKIGGAPAITDSKTAATVATGTGSFTIGITGLSPGENYYFNCYATNSNGTTLGTPTYILMPGGPATVSATTAVTSITSNSGTSGGNVTDDGGYTILERGICWATSQNPTDSNAKQTASGTTGSFSANLSSLSASTTYYVRAYARNSYATVYGTQVSFTTSAAITIPTVTTTSPATSIASTSATVSGNVSADGGGSVTSKGICYNTSGTPTTANSTVASGSGTGSISSNLTGLTGSTTYHCRAYAINSAGTAYGAEVDFTTSVAVTIPTVSTTSPATSIGAGSATVAGNVSADGGASVSEKGICYNTTGTPTNYDSKVTSGTGTGSISSVLTGLSASTTYHCRAYATNSQGTAYGSEVDFTTSSAAAPSVTTGYASPYSPSVHRTSPTKNDVNIINNEVTSDGGSTITERGVCYLITDGTPTTANTKTTASGTTGLFDVLIAGFARDTQTIWYRAYAINSLGTSYGVTRSILLDDAFWYQ